MAHAYTIDLKQLGLTQYSIPSGLGCPSGTTIQPLPASEGVTQS